MKAASACRMAEVPHALRFTQHLRPRHFVQVILERHWMGNKLQAFIQAAVRFDVQVFSVLVRDVEQLLRVAVHRATVIDFKLYAEMTQTFAVENKVRRVTVLVNNVTMLIPAGRAVGVVVTVPVRAVAMNNAATVPAADVILIKAMLTQSVGIVLDGVFLVDPLGTVVTDYGQAVGTIAFRLIHVFNWVFCTAVCTNPRFLHWLFLHFV